MSDTTKITIPDEVVTAAVRAVDFAATDETTATISVALEAAAPLIVAVAYEQLADDLDAGHRYDHAKHLLAASLRLRIAALRGVSGVSADGGEKTDA